VAEKSKEIKTTESPKKLLDRSVNLPVKGKLAKNVRAPKWLRAIVGYFVESFKELGRVQWPNRRATWSLTLAVIIFTLVIAALILGLDYAFEQLFKRIIL
jgi:preprotein translocase SecE subunit